MPTLIDWFTSNFGNIEGFPPSIIATLVGITFVIFHDFYTLLFNAIFSHFKK